MRITDEQAKSMAKSNYITGKNLSETLIAYAKDLLEARAERDLLARKLKESNASIADLIKTQNQINVNLQKIKDNQDRAIIQQQVQPDGADKPLAG